MVSNPMMTRIKSSKSIEIRTLEHGRFVPINKDLQNLVSSINASRRLYESFHSSKWLDNLIDESASGFCVQNWKTFVRWSSVCLAHQLGQLMRHSKSFEKIYNARHFLSVATYERHLEFCVNMRARARKRAVLMWISTNKQHLSLIEFEPPLLPRNESPGTNQALN